MILFSSMQIFLKNLDLWAPHRACNAWSNQYISTICYQTELSKESGFMK